MLQRLDAVQRRALRLVDGEEHQQPAHVTSLEQQRDVSALVVFHKAQVQEVPHLGRLRLTPRPAQRCTRAALTTDKLVEVPRSHLRQHQRTFTARTTGLWNRFTAATPDVPNISTDREKLSAHRWRGTRDSTLVLYIV